MNKLAKSRHEKNIGINIPSESCTDKNCPFHGSLSVRGQLIKGVVVSKKMQRTLVVKRSYMHYIQKYERYGRRTSVYTAHCPPCLKLELGDTVKIAECRPLSKTVSFVAIEKI